MGDRSTHIAVKTQSDKKTSHVVKKPKVDIKGIILCKAKDCEQFLYKNESSSFKGYCQDCG